MKQEKMEVAVIGALNIDITGAATVPFSSGDSLPGELRFSTGGVGWNVARNAALMAVQTGFFAILGADGYEKNIRAEAERCGVDIQNCRWEKAPNCCYLRILDDGGRLVASVNDMNFCRKMDSFFVKDAARKMAEAKVIAAECNLQADTLHRLTEECGDTPIVADCVSAAKCMRLEKILPRLHTVKANVSEAERLSGYAGPERCATALLKKGVQRVCITLDGEGLLLADRENLFRLPALTQESSDMGGAGDAVTAALAVSLAREMSLEKTAKLALAAAAVSARAKETVSPDIAKLKSFIKN